MHGLDREHAIMLTGAIPTLMLNHLQVFSVECVFLECILYGG